MRVGIEVIVGTGFIIVLDNRNVVRVEGGVINGFIVAVGVGHRVVEVGALGGVLGVFEANLSVVELMQAAEAARALIRVGFAALSANHLIATKN